MLGSKIHHEIQETWKLWTLCVALVEGTELSHLSKYAGKKVNYPKERTLYCSDVLAGLGYIPVVLAIIFSCYLQQLCEEFAKMSFIF